MSEREAERRLEAKERFPESAQLLDRLYDLCDLQNDELSGWDARFVDSITRKVENGYGLGLREKRKLEEIERRAFD